MRDKTSWKKELKSACEITGDTFDDLSYTLTPEELHEEFDNGFGGTEGCPFTAWGEKYVYFPWQYDGAEGVAYVPRNPCDYKTEHIGGG